MSPLKIAYGEELINEGLEYEYRGGKSTKASDK